MTGPSFKLEWASLGQEPGAGLVVLHTIKIVRPSTASFLT